MFPKPELQDDYAGVPTQPMMMLYTYFDYAVLELITSKNIS